MFSIARGGALKKPCYERQEPARLTFGYGRIVLWKVIAQAQLVPQYRIIPCLLDGECIVNSL
jgi:hypothetical protein